jgi:branched-subunit amino acid transport protein
MSNTSLLLLILCLFGASYLPRQVPQWFSDWMKYVPISLFAALVFKDVFISGNHFEVIGNVRIIAMFLVAGVAYKTRSMAISVITGLAAIFLLSMI